MNLKEVNKLNYNITKIFDIVYRDLEPVRVMELYSLLKPLYRNAVKNFSAISDTMIDTMYCKYSTAAKNEAYQNREL